LLAEDCDMAKTTKSHCSPSSETDLILDGRRPTVLLSGGRAGGTCGARQLNYRAASSRAAQAARPLQLVLGGGKIERRLFDLEVVKRLPATAPRHHLNNRVLNQLA
jgi:hypothetical protein